MDIWACNTASSCKKMVEITELVHDSNGLGNFFTHGIYMAFKTRKEHQEKEHYHGCSMKYCIAGCYIKAYLY